MLSCGQGQQEQLNSGEELAAAPVFPVDQGGQGLGFKGFRVNDFILMLNNCPPGILNRPSICKVSYYEKYLALGGGGVFNMSRKGLLKDN